MIGSTDTDMPIFGDIRGGLSPSLAHSLPRPHSVSTFRAVKSIAIESLSKSGIAAVLSNRLVVIREYCVLPADNIGIRYALVARLPDRPRKVKQGVLNPVNNYNVSLLSVTSDCLGKSFTISNR